MDVRLGGALLCTVVAAMAAPQNESKAQGQITPLTVPAGAPLRLYLTKRIPKRADAPVEAKLLASVYAFDREVIPVGTQVLGHVSSVQPVSKWVRGRAILGGDFTPLHTAKVQFTTVVLPNGRQMPLRTIESQGLNSLVPLKPPKQRSQAPTSKPGALGKAKQTVKDQISAQIDRVRGIPDLVRGPNKMEMISDFLMSKLPYHPQYVHNRTRFDAELSGPLDFGSETVTPDSLALLGSQPAAGSVAHARLLTPLDSSTSKKGEKAEAVLLEPLFANGHMLVLPEGTQLEGVVVLAKRAGWFHRGGHILFNFQSVDLPPQVAQLRRSAPADAPPQQQANLQFKTRANLTAAESGSATVKVDEEGSVRATESKTRFLGTALALLIAHRAGDTDAGHNHAGASTGESSNVGGRTLGGGMGLGLLGTGLAQISPNVGAVLGYYGLAWSVYSTVVARGAEVQFRRNAAVDIGFSDRPRSSPNKLKSDATKGTVD